MNTTVTSTAIGAPVSGNTMVGTDSVRLMPLVADALDRSDNVVAVIERVGPAIDDLLIVGVNDAFCRMAEYAHDAMIGRPFMMLACAATGPELRALIAEAVETRTSLRTEMHCATRNGRNFWFGLHLMPAAEAGMVGRHFVVLGRDITARLQASQQQRAIQELLANVFLSVEAAVAIVGADGRFLMTNPQLDRLLGTPAGSLVGKPTLDTIAPASRPVIEAARQRQQADDKPYTVDVQALRGDGSELAVRLTSVPIKRTDLQRCRIVTVSGQAPSNQPVPVPVPMPVPVAPPDILVAGKIKLIGLEEVRAALGAQWEAMAERALASAEHVIQRRLGPADTWSRTQDQGFVICFSGTTEQEASFRAAMIGREIRARLIGQGEDPAASQVSTITASVKLPPGGEAAGGHTLQAMLEERLNARRADLETEARLTLQQAVQAASCRLEPIHGRAGANPIAHHACLPAALERRIASAMSVLPSDRLTDFDLDTLMLGLAAERSMQDALHGSATLMMVNVSFDAFVTRARADRYIEHCARLDARLRQRLVLLLSQLPPEIGRSRVLDCANRLRPFCRSIGFEIDEIELPPVDLALAGAPIVAINAERWGGGGALPESRLVQMLRTLHTHRGRMLIRRVASAEVAARLGSLGVDFLSVDPAAGR